MCAPLRALCREGASAQFKAPLSLLKFWIHFEQGTLPFHFELGPPVLAGLYTQRYSPLVTVIQLLGSALVHLSAACGLSELSRSRESGMDKVHLGVGRGRCSRPRELKDPPHSGRWSQGFEGPGAVLLNVMWDTEPYVDLGGSRMGLSDIHAGMEHLSQGG